MSPMVIGWIIVILCLAASANADVNTCTPEQLSLSPCADYIIGAESSPSFSCCSHLSSIVSNADPQCLCQLLDSTAKSSSGDLSVNSTRVNDLLVECNVQASQMNECRYAGQSIPQPYYQSPPGTLPPPPPPPPSPVQLFADVPPGIALPPPGFVVSDGGSSSKAAPLLLIPSVLIFTVFTVAYSATTLPDF